MIRGFTSLWFITARFSKGLKSDGVLSAYKNEGKLFNGTRADRLLECDFDNVSASDWFEPCSSTDMKKAFWGAMAEEEYRIHFDIPVGITKEEFEREDKRLAQAFKTARAARFEFGERVCNYTKRS